MSRWCLSGAVLLVCASFAEVAEPDRKDRGKEYLLSRTYSPASISTSAYDNVWKEWGLKEKPADFKHQLLQRYGLHKALLITKATRWAFVLPVAPWVWVKL